jgi:hypothetical protein
MQQMTVARIHAFVLILSVAAFLLAPMRAAADGMPPVGDPEVWASLSETMQVAVVTLQPGENAQVDLFVSLVDSSGTSHQIVFLLPLGIDPSGFQVSEQTSADFDEQVTADLDELLRKQLEQEADYQSGVLQSMLPGLMVINGGWSWPLWLVLSLASCGGLGAASPVATYETASSQISIYNIDENTDLQELIRDTGLDPAVREALTRLEGQQVAVVNLQTQPVPEPGTQGSEQTGQPGLHLAWRSGLVPGPDGPTYSYPLGTGSGWAQPIEQTRVYVVAPPGMDFEVQYPELGLDLSGFTLRNIWAGYRPRIQSATEPAFAADNAVGEFGRVWRVTYMQSNAAQDIRITPLATVRAETQAALDRLARHAWVLRLSWLVSLVLGLAFWLVAWRYVMPPMLRVHYRWRERRFWLDALKWSFVYVLATLIPAGAIALIVFLGSIIMGGVSSELVTIPLILAGFLAVASGIALSLALLGTANLVLFVRDRARVLGVSRGRAFAAYVLVVLLANAAYLAAALAYTRLVGAL